MSERDGFVRAIRERPDDEALRLVYADWLDERGDPLGEFIRLQCELEPLRERESEHVARLLRREQEMLDRHMYEWLGPLLQRNEDAYFGFGRGLVECASLSAKAFVKHAAELEERCPGLRSVTLSGVRGRGAALAGCSRLAGLREMEVQDWLTEADGEALAASPHLAGLRTLSLWLGSRHDPAVCRALARSKKFRGLEEVRLVQLYGGTAAGDRAGELAGRADGLANEVNRLRRKKIAHVERPFERLFPLDGNLGYGLYAGRLPGGRQALAAIDWDKALVMAVFNGQGNHTGTEHRDLGETLVRKPERDYERYHEGELLEYLAREFGFELALIHVKEFYLPDDDLGVSLGLDTEALEDPDAARSGYYDEPYQDVLRDYGFWVEGENFAINWGNSYWAGPNGRIHTS